MLYESIACTMKIRPDILSPNCDSRHIHWLLKLEGTPACPETRENVRFVDQMKSRMNIILSLVVRFITKSEKFIFQNIIFHDRVCLNLSNY